MANSSDVSLRNQRPFQRLLSKKRNAVKYKANMAHFLMACANQEHQAIAKLIQHWMGDLDVNKKNTHREKP